jgi:hypothetical protein
MYLVETGFGQAFRPRSPRPSRPTPTAPARRAPKDRLEKVVTTWELEVPFRKDFKAFRQEVVTAIERHVAANEKTTIGRLMSSSGDSEAKLYHDFYSAKSTAESNLVFVKVRLTFKAKNYTGLSDLFIGPIRKATLKDILD